MPFKAKVNLVKIGQVGNYVLWEPMDVSQETPVVFSANRGAPKKRRGRPPKNRTDSGTQLFATPQANQ